MIIRKLFSQLELSPGDEVACVTAWRDMLVIVTVRGAVYRVEREDHDG